MHKRTPYASHDKVLVWSTVGAALFAAVPAQAQTDPPDCTRRFSPQRVITAEAERPHAVYAADLDGDGDIDVLSASWDGNKIAWYENTDGFGTFGLQQVITTETQAASSVFAADLDGDGDHDVLSASGSDDKIAWYENTDGMGSFGPQQLITTQANDAASVIAADLDSDGDMDVVIGAAGSGSAWFENTDGLGTFGPEQVIDSLGTRSVFAIDLDGDGHLDVVSALQYSIGWYKNTDWLGTFGAQQVITTSVIYGFSVVAADLDGDGDNDVLAAALGDYEIAWYENTDGLGMFGPQQVITTAIQGPTSVFAADLDGDGDSDVLSSSLPDDKLAWHENTDALGTFGPQRIITTAGGGPMFVVAADLDGDGDQEALAAFRADSVSWFDNDPDCNQNGVNDGCDVADGISADCNGNNWPDECDIAIEGGPDCNDNNTPDECEPDCNGNGMPDDCDLAAGTSTDCNGSGVPDECETDCNSNGVHDDCDVAEGTSTDCNGDGVPDECEPDCNGNGVVDECDIASGTSTDCNGNSDPDECDIVAGTSLDCNGNGSPDECDLAGGNSDDCNSNNIPDECESSADCNSNGVRDFCDVANGTSDDCNLDEVPDDCQLDEDCDANGVRDLCELELIPDCNENLAHDDCDLLTGRSLDEDMDGIPDKCCDAVPPAFVVERTGSRYIALTSIAPPGVAAAIRITPVSLPGFEEFEGIPLWVGPPGEYPDEDVSEPNQTFIGAPLACEPYYHNWGDLNVVHVFGGEIMPQAEYVVQVIHEGCDTQLQGNFSDALVVATGEYGDNYPPFEGTFPQPDFGDIAGAVNKFLGAPGAPIKALAQLQPNVVFPDRPVDFRDIGETVESFLASPYELRQPGPCACPSAVTCGAAPCAIDGQCGGGLCVAGFCRDSCGRCTP